MSSAAAKTIKGVLTYEEFLTIFESHNRAYLDEVGCNRIMHSSGPSLYIIILLNLNDI
jgi:hypothetical protein